MFIADIRNCTSKEQEQRRVDKELANIRAKFTGKGIDGYSKKKYVWKLVYMYMLGYDVEVGHMEALKLISSPIYTEKSAGYMACSILLNENAELLRLIIQSVKKDLDPSNEVNQCLALACIANVGGQEFAESLTADVQKILISGKSRSFVRKKAALCLLRLFRKYPDAVQSESFASKVIALLEDNNIGVVLSVMSLMLGLVSHNAKGYEEVPGKCIFLLTKLVFSKEKKSIYKYYLTICPWLQVKLLRCLLYFPAPTDKNLQQRLNHVLTEILTKTTITKNVNKNNADHAILFEAVQVIIHLCVNGQTELQSQAVGLLGRFVSIREPNFRYLGLDTMTKVARVPGSLPSIKRHQSTVQFSLKDPDVSIRKRALDLLYVMCDKSNSQEIVGTLLKYLQTASYDMREELVLKVAILAEKFPSNLQWYLDVILQLISIAGDFVTDDIWFRVVQIVTNNEDLQDYAATTCYKFLKGASVHENGLKVGGYILGEFGHQIKDTSVTGEILLEALESKFPLCSNPTKAILLTAYAKMANTYPSLKTRVDEIFKQHRTYVDAEIQQRANEYHAMHGKDEKLMNMVFDVMPNFPVRESVLMKRIQKAAKHTTDRDVFKTDAAAHAPESAKDEESEESEGEDDKKKEESEEEEEEEEKEFPTASEHAHHASHQPASTAAAAAPSSGSSSSARTINLFDVLGEEAPAAHAHAHAPAGRDNGDSIFGSSAFGGAAPAADLDMPAQSEATVQALQGKETGVLYESKAFQIGVKMVFEMGYQCKMVLYYGNKTEHTFTNVSASVNEDAFRAQIRPAEPFAIKPREQVMHLFLWHCMKPFSLPATVNLKLTCENKSYALSLKVPFSLPCFMVPDDVKSTDFIPAWQQSGHEVMGVRKLPSAISLDSYRNTVEKELHMKLIDGVEAGKPQNICAAGKFHTATKAPDGQFVNIACYLRMETKEGVPMVRVTVHSGHQSVSSALSDAITRVFHAST